MKYYFDKFLYSKLCLYKMVSQFLTTYVSVEDADMMNLKVENDNFKHGDYVEVCFHDFLSEGILAWKYLDLENDYVTHNDIWKLEYELEYTKYDSNINYYNQYLKNCILLIDMTKRYYGYKISLEDALKNNIKFNDIDELNDEVDICDHYCESAGEHVWNLFKIEDSIVGQSIFENQRKHYVDELLQIKEKELVKK